MLEKIHNPEGEFKISFGYECNAHNGCSCLVPNGFESLPGKIPRNNSFSRLSGAALSANATLANTNICNGVIGAEILPSWDSPNSFRRIPSSPTLSRLDVLSSSLQSSMSNLSCSPPTPSPPECDSCSFRSMSAPSRNEGFLNAMEVQVAGGAAGEDRVQAVCSEENGWLFCAIYDGFNGRDAADFLAVTLYENIIHQTRLLDCELKQDVTGDVNGFYPHSPFQHAFKEADNSHVEKPPAGTLDENNSKQEMEDRPDLVSVGSCVLVSLLHRMDLYTLNLGDSRAVLATYDEGSDMKGFGRLKAIQLTDSHTVDNELERSRVLSDHPEDPTVIAGGKVKGKLKVTRAMGVGYLKKKKPKRCTDGYSSSSNDEAVKLVHSYIMSNPNGDPAKFLLEQLVGRAADCAGFSMEELMNIPAGRRRKYHDDVTVMVIILGINQRTSKASTWV
ncbi:PROTEIN PHOSPHATASE 2C 40-RELATED [Salix koriyanagi]|uniref:PROTEIN PHOSPHATASE 2C 40-RELATED n=1 Tax=Salix koriyanagi TaxID=2511006 RepID=A0A9Q0VCN2_9ROSI|nr:PROTEIN PHOSPHATASE 2C 40-RELATED [Salix koriyanagi]